MTTLADKTKDLNNFDLKYRKALRTTPHLKKFKTVHKKKHITNCI